MPDFVKVVPAILTEDLIELARMVRQAELFSAYVQIDIMDGQFVPSRSITWNDLIKVKPKLDWEAHLMVQHPFDYLEGFAEAGAKKIVFHFEAADPKEMVIVNTRQLGMKVGLAIKPETKVSDFISLINKVDSILLLTVHPGFYGGEFIPDVLSKVTVLRNSSQKTVVGVDGGVHANNIAQVARSGINDIYIGSAIFGHPNPAERYAELERLAHEA
jgi:ribulose-phosphate 3-epimerase